MPSTVQKKWIPRVPYNTETYKSPRNSLCVRSKLRTCSTSPARKINNETNKRRSKRNLAFLSPYFSLIGTRIVSPYFSLIGARIVFSYFSVIGARVVSPLFLANRRQDSLPLFSPNRSQEFFFQSPPVYAA